MRDVHSVWRSSLDRAAGVAVLCVGLGCGPDSISSGPDGSLGGGHDADEIVDGGNSGSGGPDANAGGADGFIPDDPPPGGGLILYGGETESREASDETWLWDGESWQEASPRRSPDARMDHAMTYDPVRDEVFLFGGQTGGNTGYFDDTWTWNGEVWEPVDSEPPSDLQARSGHGLIFFGTPGAEYPLLIGGQTGTASLLRQHDTWIWIGDEWVEQTTGEKDFRTRFGMAFHAGAGEAVLFGGDDCCNNVFGNSVLGDTWTRDQSTWSRANPPGDTPEERRGHAMAYDPTRERVVLYGGEDGSDYLGDTWEWDGATWTEIDTSGQDGAPPPLRWPALAFDPATETILLFGGSLESEEYTRDTYSWDGETWEHLEGVGGPAEGLAGHALAQRPSP